MVRSSAALAALALLVTPARAADAPGAAWTRDNPFCQVVAQVAPFADGSGYGLKLYAANGRTVDAHVTLVSDTDAYDAHVANVPLTGSAGDRESDGVALKFDQAVKVKYFFVDSYALDGGASATCPSFVFPIGEQLSDSPAGAVVVTPQHVQAIGKLACGQMYEPIQFGRDTYSVVGAYGNKPLSVTIHAYIDSDGRVLREKVVSPSGVYGVDSTALGIVEIHQFVAARFLCTPVVGEFQMRFDYEP
ncbi:MAG: energy transducer TonB [Candidatus Baltobacteraceae bacterium]